MSSETPAIILYSKTDTPRLRYVLHWLFSDVLGTGYFLVNEVPDFLENQHFIAYGDEINGALLTIPASGLLAETDVHAMNIATGSWQNVPTLFALNAPGDSLPFDLFSAVFYLISRYEEYLPFTADKHGRYPASASILFQSDWLQRPIIDEWIFHFRNELLLRSNGALNIPALTTIYQPTYDIDIAFSHKHKGWKRTLGGILRDFLKLDFSNSLQRFRVMAGAEKDPYDSFDFILNLHRTAHVSGHFFILSAANDSPFDKNISLQNGAYQNVLQQLQRTEQLSIHPSYFFNEQPGLIAQEIELLKNAAQLNAPITDSRQHYIRSFMPGTYRVLLAHGITHDWSMGYATHFGFRAGTSRSFKWYDLQQERVTGLTITPFCFMDTTAHYDQQLSVSAAFAALRSLRQQIFACGGQLITIFHNFSLGTDKEWTGWPAAYEASMLETVNSLDKK